MEKIIWSKSLIQVRLEDISEHVLGLNETNKRRKRTQSRTSANKFVILSQNDRRPYLHTSQVHFLFGCRGYTGARR